MTKTIRVCILASCTLTAFGVAGGGCSQDDLKSTGGNGLLYCFATN